MSNVNIKRAVDNIRSGTNPYTPLVEVIVNGIQAIDSAEIEDGLVEVTVIRSLQSELDSAIPDVTGFTIKDNGVGFNEDNRDAFNTLYTSHKIEEGGKGFGRFTCLKYFHDVRIESVFITGQQHMLRTFNMGKETELIVDEQLESTEPQQTGSTVWLISLHRGFPDKGLAIIARSLVEKLLPYFINEDRRCPAVVLKEEDGSDSILLNEYVGKPGESLIVEEASARGEFSFETADGAKQFVARVFKVYSARMRRSRISLVAHRREVVSTSLHNYIPEFSEEFYENIQVDGVVQTRNFIVAVYVFGEYLDANVSVERGGFEFHKDSELLLGISQRDIESAAAEFARGAVAGEVSSRQERKTARIWEYVRDNAPWHAVSVREADLSMVPYGATDEEIEAHLHREKHAREVHTRQKVNKLLKTRASDQLAENAAAIVSELSESSRSELVHYVALRKSVLDIFERSLAVDASGKYSSERVVHEVIFPTKRDTANTRFEEHNLWIINEGLNFTEYLTSDIPLGPGNGDRPDLLAFDRRMVFRGKNEASNPVTVFEFKKPQREDFVDPSSKEDPIQQIIRYVVQIKAGKYRTPAGRDILVAENTPFFGYVVCDLTTKVRAWLEDEKDFKPMPDRLGYFKWHENLNLYMEVLGWDKVLKDASIRNKVFFHKLGIS
jgi:hypothetical protein